MSTSSINNNKFYGLAGGGKLVSDCDICIAFSPPKIRESIKSAIVQAVQQGLALGLELELGLRLGLVLWCWDRVQQVVHGA